MSSLNGALVGLQNSRCSLFDFMNEDGYYEASVSENCHADHIIDTAHKCKDAALVLGLKYGGVHNNDEYPAGCYWNSVTGHVTEVNLNQITDPSQTKPGFFGIRCGICITSKH